MEWLNSRSVDASASVVESLGVARISLSRAITEPSSSSMTHSWGREYWEQTHNLILWARSLFVCLDKRKDMTRAFLQLRQIATANPSPIFNMFRRNNWELAGGGAR